MISRGIVVKRLSLWSLVRKRSQFAIIAAASWIESGVLKLNSARISVARSITSRDNGMISVIDWAKYSSKSCNNAASPVRSGLMRHSSRVNSSDEA
jgi:hypothetical protein